MLNKIRKFIKNNNSNKLLSQIDTHNLLKASRDKNI